MPNIYTLKMILSSKLSDLLMTINITRQSYKVLIFINKNTD